MSGGRKRTGLRHIPKLPVPPRLFAKRGLYERFIGTIKITGLNASTHPVLIGLSGGLDSVVLLHLLLIRKFNVTVAHLNHQIRGRESLRDEQFVKNLCAHWKIPLITERVPVRKLAKENRQSIEEAARDARYRFFHQIARRNQIRTVLVAHHLRDQAETVLMKILFGADRNKLRGMPLIRTLGPDGQKSTPRNRVQLIRPLLQAPYEEILTYGHQNQLPYCEDSTNRDLHYPRNWIRHQLIPLIERKLNRNIVRSLARLGEDLTPTSNA